jgi:hypothetical protein
VQSIGISPPQARATRVNGGHIKSGGSGSGSGSGSDQLSLQGYSLVLRAIQINPPALQVSGNVQSV